MKNAPKQNTTAAIQNACHRRNTGTSHSGKRYASCWNRTKNK